MVRGYLSVPALVLVAGAVLLQPGPPPEDAVVTVTVNATACTAANMSVSISPWVASITRADSVAWAVGGQADSVAIQPLNRGGRAWPFQRANPGMAKRNERASSGPVRGNAQTGSYFYQIRMFCGGREIIIDPEVFIEDN